MISIYWNKTSESLPNNGVDDKHAHGFNIFRIETCMNISYIGFRQVIWAHITCLCFIFPEPKAREIYNTDRLYEPVLPV
jgi:hypothetical protein